MKYYGLATKRIDGKKTAFFLDGEEIILAPEGYTVKKLRFESIPGFWVPALLYVPETLAEKAPVMPPIAHGSGTS